MSNQINPNDGNPPVELILAIRKLLKPLVKLLLSFRIAFPQFVELLKSTYVAVAEEEFALDNKKSQTDSRLSLLTGINRKEIKRLRMQSVEREDAPEIVSTGVRLVARWVSKSKYLSDEGVPLALSLRGESGEASFESLVKDVFKQDIHPRAILDELLDSGVVRMREDKMVTLNTQSYVPSGLKEKAFFLGHNLADHIAASAENLIAARKHNLIDEPPPFFERCLYYDGLSAESIEELKELAVEKGTETLLKLNERAMDLKAIDTEKVQDKFRFNAGLYVYHEPENRK